MNNEISAHDAVEQAASAFDREVADASERVQARTAQHSRFSLPIVLGAAAVAFFVLPKSLRKTVIAAALPFGANWIRGLFRPANKART